MATGKKRAGSTAVTTGEAKKKAKTTQEQQENKAEVLAPEEAPSSGNIIDEAPEITPEKAGTPALLEEETRALIISPQLELIPGLIMNDLPKDDADEVMGALMQLSSLSLGLDGRTDEARNNCKQIFEYGGHAVILLALQRFPDVVAVQVSGCRAIGYVLDKLPLSHRKDAGAIGTVEAVVKAMKSFPQHADLQYVATLAMESLLKACRENADRFMKAPGGIPAVVAAMANSPDCIRIQLSGCGVVYWCADLLHNRSQLLIEHDALIVVSKALKNHQGHEGVKKWARKALTALAKED